MGQVQPGGHGAPFPPTATKGLVWTSKGGGADGAWKEIPAAEVAAITSSGDSDSYVIMSPVAAWVSGDTNWINQFFKYVSGTLALAGVLGHVHSGTATVDVYHGHPNATTLLSAVGLDSLAFTTTPTLFVPSSPVNVMNQDALRIQITASSGGPLTATFFWDKS
jgi:hypothetical protein